MAGLGMGELMSFINSDLNTPLNHMIWLNDYKTYGENSYVFRDKRILKELYASPIAANDIQISGEAFNYIVDTEKVGSFFDSIYEVKNKEPSIEWSQLKTMNDVAENMTALKAIFTSEIGLEIIMSSEIALSIIDNCGSAIETSASGKITGSGFIISYNLDTSISSDRYYRGGCSFSVDGSTIKSLSSVNGSQTKRETYNGSHILFNDNFELSLSSAGSITGLGTVKYILFS